MDMPEDDLDIKLQKISGDLVADFDRSLPVLLRKRDGSLRSRVRSREAYRLTSDVLGPFQELPQLLDPHLPKWLPVLAEAYLELRQPRRHMAKSLSLRKNLLMPLSTAISMILYYLCKIRGEKVVVRFLNVEARYLEPLLAAFEDAERLSQSETSSFVKWSWEERYIVLLWLSHLMLAPFDLATISSTAVDEDDIPPIAGFRWPKDLPGISVRVLPLAIKYLSSPGKERDAAKTLLVRISMRKDMQQLGLLDALVQWALSVLRPQKDNSGQTPYQAIGVLSYLAGILTSTSDTSDMDKYSTIIFRTVHGIVSEGDSEPAAIPSSALARKMAIKVIRSIAVLVMRNAVEDAASTELIETTIGYLLESLADNDTPVRLAASKALSIITLKLDAEMAAQVVDTVLESLNRNVLWNKNAQNPKARSTRDLSAVDALEWHGLMLTLSHLIYRRSPPAETLADIIRALVMGLAFEQRSASGSSVGTNVRDAACFGIWALARRYTTAELLAVPNPTIAISSFSGTETSVLQILATELVVAACLDPAGNIRRGSSAALQELIGRHPDTVEQGIWVVQTVDYHAVARRSRAIKDVALAATKLSPKYGTAILDALLGWRGLGYSDAAARRAAGTAYGAITAELASATGNPVLRLQESLLLILDRVKTLQQREVEELHGLLLSFAAVLDSLPVTMTSKVYGGKPPPFDTMATLELHANNGLCHILGNCQTKTYRRPELVAEAACRLIISFFPLLQATSMKGSTGGEGYLSKFPLLPGPTLISMASSAEFSHTVSALDSTSASGGQAPSNVTNAIKTTVCEWLNRQEAEVVAAASEASLILLLFCQKPYRKQLMEGWANTIRHRTSARAATAGGHFAALTMCYPVVLSLGLGGEDDASLLTDALLTRWVGDKDIETRVSILQSLTGSELLMQNSGVFLDLIVDGLEDYTTNARGDVGSHVRLEAIRATKSLWKDLDSIGPENSTMRDVVSKLFLRVLRLAAEKLDRVRVEAQSALHLALGSSSSSKLGQLTFSSKQYFFFLLSLLSGDWLHPVISTTAKTSSAVWMEELMAGFVSSADTGNEDLVIASRAALCDFCEASPAHLDDVCTALARNLKTRQGNDRVIVPTLEIVAFLFHAGLFGRSVSSELDYRSLCLYVQKTAYKTGNVRKLEACVRVYGAIAAAGSDTGKLDDHLPSQRRPEGALEARKRLGALMFHPWPRIRTCVVDEVWSLMSGPHRGVQGQDAANRLKGVDWGKAEKGNVRALVEAVGLS